ncbi:MAG: carboxypeptidase regulatory-like domain-containing protein [Verrucomicrobia bacterium]|nr:carboxypeptidase regulatory-like domain-containing protein [Verrucomicrobiota bacterium]
MKKTLILCSAALVGVALLLGAIAWQKKLRSVSSEAKSESGPNAVSVDANWIREMRNGTTTNTNDLHAMQYIVAIMAGHKPEKLPPGLTPEYVSNVYFKVFIAPNIIPQKPINFWGKVLDENGEAVSGARAHFKVIGASTNQPAETDDLSDGSGSFSLKGRMGVQLTVDVSKSGYYESRSNRQVNFFWYSHQNSGEFNPEPNKPVIYHLHKIGQGTDLITSQYGIARELSVATSDDGTPVFVDLLTRKAGSTGHLEINRTKTPNGNWKQVSEWSFQLRVPDGGLIEHHDEFPFHPPEQGYQPSVDFKFSRDTTNYVTHFEKSYYIAFGNPRRYGHIHVQTSLFGQTRLEYAINPDGSRYLEGRKDASLEKGPFR